MLSTAGETTRAHEIHGCTIGCTGATRCPAPRLPRLPRRRRCGRNAPRYECSPWECCHTSLDPHELTLSQASWYRGMQQATPEGDFLQTTLDRLIAEDPKQLGWVKMDDLIEALDGTDARAETEQVCFRHLGLNKRKKAIREKLAGLGYVYHREGEKIPGTRGNYYSFFTKVPPPPRDFPALSRPSLHHGRSSPPPALVSTSHFARHAARPAHDAPHIARRAAHTPV